MIKLVRSSAIAAAFLIGIAPLASFADAGPHDATAASAIKGRVAVGPQYDTTHVYVASADVDTFVQSFLATFGGKASQKAVFTVTPTPSKTASQYVQTPVGMLSVFGFETPVPYPFGNERTGYLVTDIDDAVKAARAAGADVIVEPFDDPIGKDAIIQWPGGLVMQLYWHARRRTTRRCKACPTTASMSRVTKQITSCAAGCAFLMARWSRTMRVPMRA